MRAPPGSEDSYFLKGGVAFEQRGLGRGFDEFSFRLKAWTRDMEQADTVRVNVAVA
ncbi:MAG: hypothetical protein U0R19_34360 [Bryobacteraceae bacterium]